MLSTFCFTWLIFLVLSWQLNWHWYWKSSCWYTFFSTSMLLWVLNLLVDEMNSQRHCFHCHQEGSFLLLSTNVSQTSSTLKKMDGDMKTVIPVIRGNTHWILQAKASFALHYPNNCLLAPWWTWFECPLKLISLFTFSSVCPNTLLRSSPDNFLFYSVFGCFRGSTPGGTKGHLSRQRTSLLPIISALQAFLIKELSLPSSSYYFLRLFFFLSKIPLETKTSDRTATLWH